MALSKIDVSKMITGVTPLANGGTGGTSIPATNLASGVTGTLPVGSGGTGIVSGTTDQFLKFTGTTTLASAADNAGKIIQTKMEGNYNFSGDTSSNSETYAAFGNAITITPTSSSNALLFQMMISDVYISSSEGIRIDIYDETNSTWVSGSLSRKASLSAGSTVNGINLPVTLMEILETAGSGARTYKGYYRSEQAGETVYINNGGSNGFQRFCVMEVVKDD